MMYYKIIGNRICLEKKKKIIKGNITRISYFNTSGK